MKRIKHRRFKAQPAKQHSSEDDAGAGEEENVEERARIDPDSEFQQDSCVICLCEFEDGTPADACLDGDAYLQRLNFDDDSIALSCVLLMVLAVAFNAAAYSVLVARRPHFQKLEPPATTALKSKLANSAVGVSSTESYQ